MSELILFWHRRDLRIDDNIGLAAARDRSPKVVGVFCLDPQILERDDVAPARVTYMIGCLQKLQQRYAEAGSQLLIVRDLPVHAIASLAENLKAKAVYWNRDVEPYAQQRDEAVSNALKEKGIEFSSFWDQLLNSPEPIHTGIGKVYTIYTPFWKNWRRKPKPAPVATLANAENLTAEEREWAQAAGIIALPTAKDLGFIWENELLLPPGEKAAQDRLGLFVDRAIEAYQEQRDFPYMDGTSMLSAALRFGAIGIRRVWEAAKEAWEEARSDRSRTNIETWQKELAWREFYQHGMYHLPSLATGPYRPHFKNFPWDNNEAHFQAWCEGQTGYPIVDAAMRQLNATGWMHNRCRMIAASFLVKDLMIDWQWGEKYFMQKLYDGDLSANNGGWQWTASSGMDAQPMRMMNPIAQTIKFDPEGEYIRQWLPELRSADPEALVAGYIREDLCAAVGYPQPIVDHKYRQREFKRRYKQQKQLFS